MANEEKGAPETPEFDINDYTVIKEGEAEILMHVKNEVFYNKAQVNNRDMSIAVLRTFPSKRKQEHEAKALSRMRKSGAEVGKPIFEVEAIDLDGKSNGECDVSVDVSTEEPCSISENPSSNQEGKSPVKPKLPQVLEALSASGLRALRYAREVDGIGKVVALDNDKASVESCRRNIKFNGSVACSKVESVHVDTRIHMLTHPKEYDVLLMEAY